MLPKFSKILPQIYTHIRNNVKLKKSKSDIVDSVMERYSTFIIFEKANELTIRTFIYSLIDQQYWLESITNEDMRKYIDNIKSDRNLKNFIPKDKNILTKLDKNK